ncbi:MAG: transposase [Candidatus Bathyarchaeia archaeon]|nr:transposase [Candidatus Bathyarchaeia archaeon]
MFLEVDVPICVVGKVFKPNAQKILALNRCLLEFMRAVRFYVKLKDTSRRHNQSSYEEAKAMFRLPTALIQNARDKAGEILKSFEENRKEDSVLVLKRISVRFDSRCYSFSKTTNVLTPYWLSLKLNHGRRVSLPVVFGERQRQLIEDAFQGKLQFATVEMVKRKGKWYAHFVVKKTVFFEEPETVIGIDVGENNLAVAVAFKDKPRKAKFWRGSKLKQLRWKNSQVRANLQQKNKLDIVKRLQGRERRQVNQELHKLANEIVEYVKEFENPIIAMEDLTKMRNSIHYGKKMNRRLHTLPFRQLQQFIEYKALWRGIPVTYVKAKNTSKTCHRCGNVKKLLNGEVYRCSVCGMVYSRDLNASINIAKRLLGQKAKPKSEEFGGDVNPLNQQMQITAKSLI